MSCIRWGHQTLIKELITVNGCCKSEGSLLDDAPHLLLWWGMVPSFEVCKLSEYTWSMEKSQAVCETNSLQPAQLPGDMWDSPTSHTINSQWYIDTIHQFLGHLTEEKIARAHSKGRYGWATSPVQVSHISKGLQVPVTLGPPSMELYQGQCTHAMWMNWKTSCNSLPTSHPPHFKQCLPTWSVMHSSCIQNDSQFQHLL